jgi:hypothetical protein
MTRCAIPLVLICTALFSAWAQNQGLQRCSASAQFEPALVSNPEAKVTFACRNATALELIESTGRQSRKPIGIVLGEDPDLLSKTKRSYRLLGVDAMSALLEAVAGTSYTVGKSDVGFLLIAGDLTSRQRQVLTHKFADFPGGSNATMSELENSLTMWIEGEFDHPTSFVASILGSTNDETLTLGALPPSTAQQIADRIVSLGSKGLWILTIDPFQRTSGWTDEIKIEPYQHYSNLPTADD